MLVDIRITFPSFFSNTFKKVWNLLLRIWWPKAGYLKTKKSKSWDEYEAKNFFSNTIAFEKEYFFDRRAGRVHIFITHPCIRCFVKKSFFTKENCCKFGRWPAKGRLSQTKKSKSWDEYEAENFFSNMIAFEKGFFFDRRAGRVHIFITHSCIRCFVKKSFFTKENSKGNIKLWNF